jgi:hypothetical protein
MARSAWKRRRAGRINRPETMNTNTPHPVEVLAAVALAVAAALLQLLTSAVALGLTVASYRRAWPGSVEANLPQPIPPAPAPAVHPLAELAAAAEATLAHRTVAQLRQRARALGLPRSLTRAGRRADLLRQLVAVEVIACS